MWRKTTLKCSWWLDEKGLKTYVEKDNPYHQHIDRDGQSLGFCKGELLSKRKQ